VPRKKHPTKADDARWLQLLIDSIVDYAIYTIDVEGRVASWNSGAARLKGYSVEEIIGVPFAKFFTPEDQARELPREVLLPRHLRIRFFWVCGAREPVCLGECSADLDCSSLAILVSATAQ
jgi:PAS domain-containing protein